MLRRHHWQHNSARYLCWGKWGQQTGSTGLMGSKTDPTNQHFFVAMPVLYRQSADMSGLCLSYNGGGVVLLSCPVGTSHGMPATQACLAGVTASTAKAAAGPSGQTAAQAAGRAAAQATKPQPMCQTMLPAAATCTAAIRLALARTTVAGRAMWRGVGTAGAKALGHCGPRGLEVRVAMVG
jgi:hypothetical protein